MDHRGALPRHAQCRPKCCDTPGSAIRGRADLRRGESCCLPMSSVSPSPCLEPTGSAVSRPSLLLARRGWFPSLIRWCITDFRIANLTGPWPCGDRLRPRRASSVIVITASTAAITRVDDVLVDTTRPHYPRAVTATAVGPRPASDPTLTDSTHPRYRNNNDRTNFRHHDDRSWHHSQTRQAFAIGERPRWAAST
jgi:hypothetical protein